MQPNRLYFGDCLEIMQEYVPDESISFIYLDPPFNSKRIYNAFLGGAMREAFNDTWHWHEAIDDFHEVAGGEATILPALWKASSSCWALGRNSLTCPTWLTA